MVPLKIFSYPRMWHISFEFSCGKLGFYHLKCLVSCFEIMICKAIGHIFFAMEMFFVCFVLI